MEQEYEAVLPDDLESLGAVEQILALEERVDHLTNRLVDAGDQVLALESTVAHLEALNKELRTRLQAALDCIFARDADRNRALGRCTELERQAVENAALCASLGDSLDSEIEECVRYQDRCRELERRLAAIREACK